MIDFVRTLFGIRRKRRALAVSSVPPVGSTVVRKDVKIKVSQKIDPELWDWMLLSGWRVNNVKNDRRKYGNLPKDALIQLSGVSPELRAQVHAMLLNNAVMRR